MFEPGYMVIAFLSSATAQRLSEPDRGVYQIGEV